MTDIEKIIANLDPKTAARFKKASEVETQRQRVPSIGLNLALEGGLGYGRQVLVWGNKSAGKSSFCQQLIGLAQKDGKSCAWIDAENSWDKEWAEKLGVDNESLILTRSKSITDATRDVSDLMRAGTDVIVVDSISTLLPVAYFDDKDALKDVDQSKQIGAQSRDMTIATNMWNYSNNNTLLILISQQRNSFGSMHATHIPTGGKAVLFNSATIIKMWSTEAGDKQIKQEVPVGDRLFEYPVGRPVNWIVEKNKLGPMNRDGSWDFYYGGKNIGIDNVGELLDYSERYGIVTRGGAWYTIGEERLQGRSKAIAYLRDNEDVVVDLEKRLYDFF